MIIKVTYCPLVLMILFCQTLFSQNGNTVESPVRLSLQPIANLSLAGSNIRIKSTKGLGAEQILTPSSLGVVWLNYSSLVEWNTTNTICVNLNSENLPVEISIKLKIGPDAGKGAGKTGKPAQPIYLSSYPQAIITDIETCYTGQGVSSGHPLYYSLELKPEYNEKDFSVENVNFEVGVTYTFSSE